MGANLQRWRNQLVRVRLLVLAVAISLLLVPTSSVIYASGEDIRIISQSQEINFPSGVDFKLTVESTSEITEVRLLFRSTGSSQVWSYAYPSFAAGTRVTANHRLATSGGNYVPPGAEVEFQYIISDSAGNTLTTELATFEYTDTRFEWDRTQIGPLQLVHHDIRQYNVDRVASRITPAIQRLNDLLGIQNGKRIKGIIYNRRSETQEAFPFQSQVISDARVFQGFAFSNHNIFVGVGLDPRLIVHETTHLLMAQSLGERAKPLPAWLNEGFASFMEPDSHQIDSVQFRTRSMPLRSMASVSGTPSHISAFYQKAESIVDFLVQSRGEENFQEFLAELRKGRTVDQALTTVYGFDTDGLESRWAGSSTDKQQKSGQFGKSQNDGHSGPSRNSPARPSPFLFFDAWVFGGLALLVLALWGSKVVMGRLRPRAHSEEESFNWLQDENWPL